MVRCNNVIINKSLAKKNMNLRPFQVDHIANVSSELLKE